MKSPKILYLYAELMGYQIPVFKVLTEKYNAKLCVVHWDHKKLTPYNLTDLENVVYYKRSQLSKEKIIELAEIFNPDLVYVSGWMDHDYLSVIKYIKKKGVPIVAGCDNQWRGNIRQRIATIFFPFILKRYFSYIWVAGPYQYEYARKLGFKKQKIIFNCYTADLKLFNNAFSESINLKSQKYPHRFLYVGRFENIKGIDLLINAWKSLERELAGWELCLIGNGSLASYLNEQPNIIVKNFMQPEILINEIGASGCIILPSREEPWALVLHEFSAAGLPIICSDICGAAPVFVIPNYNGFIFNSCDLDSLKNKIRKIINSTDEELILMSKNSHSIGQKISPELVAASLLSVL